MNEELRSEIIKPNKQFFYDEMEDETGMNLLSVDKGQEIFLTILNDEFINFNYINPAIEELRQDNNAEISWTNIIIKGIARHEDELKSLNINIDDYADAANKLEAYCRKLINTVSECQGMAGLGVAPTPNMGKACSVNGIPVAGQSVKKKKKTSLDKAIEELKKLLD